jgi:hypothetical protein
MKKSMQAAVVILMTGLFFGCVGGPKTDTGMVEVPVESSSYYVRANGNDWNDGLSEDSPFRTLHRAVDAANKGKIKTITVLGTLNMESEGESSFYPVAVFVITGTREVEITIRGREEASEAEQGVLSTAGAGKQVIVVMGGARIRLEHIRIEGGNSEYSGAGIYVTEQAQVILGDGALVHSNHTQIYAGGVMVFSGIFTMDGGKISGNTAGGGGGVVVAKGGTFTMRDGEISGNTAQIGSGVMVAKGGCFTMEGGEISKNTVQTSDDGVGVGGGTFIMTGGEVSGNEDIIGTGGVMVLDSGTFTMKGGTISGNIAQVGGGVMVGKGGCLTIEGGEISGNTAQIGGGVGVGGTFIMTGGEVSGNTAQAGGGVMVGSNRSFFTMKGGIISGNTAQIDGGGVYVIEGGNFTMKSGEISGNRAQMGGGVMVGESGTFTLSGEAWIHTNNTVGLLLDRRLNTHSFITIGVDFTGSTDPVAKLELFAVVSNPASQWPGKTVLKPAEDYNGDLSALKDRFILGSFLRQEGSVESYTFPATPIIGYEIGDDGTLVTSGPKMDTGMADVPAGVSSYYVRADGSDGNDGFTEDTPFKTLRKAVDATTYGTIKTITVLGTLNAESEGQSNLFPDSVFTIPDARTGITIRGRGDGEQGLLSGYGSGKHVIDIKGQSRVRLEYIRIEGGNSRYSGAGLKIDNQAQVTLGEGALIRDNHSKTFGGGVGVGDSGTFTMEGGIISGNTAQYGGGGVGVDGLGTFTMRGGEISGKNSSAMNGGGVSVVYGTFVLEGGTISGNTAEGIGGVVVGGGGTFTMKGGKISGNTALGGGGVGVVVRGTFTMKAGEISGNTAQGGGGVIVGDSSTFIMEDGVISGNTIQGGGGGGGVEIIDTGTFIMRGGEISGKNSSIRDGGGVAVVNGTFALEGGTISGNTAEGGGGGVAVGGWVQGSDGARMFINSGTFIMSGGQIFNNTSKGGGGGGVVVGDGGTFTMKGGEISGNTARIGGGVAVDDSGIFTMQDGGISGNTAQIAGGGIILAKSGAFTMWDGEIFSNTALMGGGVMVAKSGTFTISGGARIHTNNAVSLLYFPSGYSSITIGGNFTGPAGPIAKIDLISELFHTDASWIDRTILMLTDGYNGDLSILKDRFILGNFIRIDTGNGIPSLTGPITGYEIGDDGTLQASGW